MRHLGLKTVHYESSAKLQGCLSKGFYWLYQLLKGIKHMATPKKPLCS